jgi:xylulokinase
MTRAVLEGIAFGLRDSLELMKGAGLGDVNQVRVTGGGARSALWRGILADVMDCEMVTVNTTEGAAYGAALLAAVGAGVWADVPSACAQTVRITGAVSPDPARAAAYEGPYLHYRELYPALKPVFGKM